MAFIDTSRIIDLIPNNDEFEYAWQMVVGYKVWLRRFYA